MEDQFYKENPSDRVWWVDTSDRVGLFLFSFDKKRAFNLFTDYPYKLTAKQKEIFDRENPFWRDYFIDRQGGQNGKI